MTREELAKGLGTKIDILNKICNDLGIKSKEIKDNEVIDIKIKYLDLYKNKIMKQRDELKNKQNQFEDYKKEEVTKLKEKQIQEEIEYKQKLEEMRMKKLEELSTDFQKRLSKEYEVIKEKFIEITKKESEIQDEKSKYTLLETEKKLFESQKEKLLSEHNQWIEEQKKIEINKLAEERTQELKEINETRKSLHKEIEIKIDKKEEELREKEAQLKIQSAEVQAKKKYLESQNESRYKQLQEKVSEEIKIYQEKIKSFERANQFLHEELTELRDRLNDCKQFEGRDLEKELIDKKTEFTRVKKELDVVRQLKNDLLVQIDKKSQQYEKDVILLEAEKTDLLEENIKVESLKSNNMILEDKALSKENHIEFLQGENKDLNNRLKSIYSDGTEIEERIKDIKEKPYRDIQLDSSISITDEIKYLDSIQNYMKIYGVAYEKRLLYAFHTALKCADFSPLTVLSGVSGTGKSKLPELYSYFGGFNFLSEAVQPTWDSPESMMGYYNTIDRKFDSTNILKFLMQTSQSKEEIYGLKESMNMILLDEMNLAHVELYFAEFLSKFEQRNSNDEVSLDIKVGTSLIHPLPLDKNVLWIGTMNEDETTKSLSDKVLDRAFSINFPRPNKLFSKVENKKLKDIKKFEYLHRDTWSKWIKKESIFIGKRSKIIEEWKTVSNEINDFLAPTGRAIGHRVWQSMEYYINNHPLVTESIDNEDELIKNVKLAFEEQLVQKIMPKLRGIEVHGEEKKALNNIQNLLNENGLIVEDFTNAMNNPYGQFIWNSANYLKED